MTANAVRDFILVFVSIVYEAMPFIVLGATIAGILEELSPRQAFAFMMAVSVFLLSVLFSPLLLPLGAAPVPPAPPADGGAAPASEGLPAPVRLAARLLISTLAALVVFFALLRCGGLIAAVLAFLGRHRIAAIAMSGLLGLIMPMCECGIIPVMRRLLRKGMPLSCCVAYLLAGPIINIVVLLSTYMAFANMETATAVDASGRPAYQLGGLGMFLLRGGLGWLVAFGTALIVERQYRIYGDDLLMPLARPVHAEEPAPRSTDSTAIVQPPTQLQQQPDQPTGEPATAAPANRPLLERLGNVCQTALHDFVDITVFLILGALLSALARQFISAETVEELSRNRPETMIAGMMLLAILLCLCSEADAFVAASFVALRPSAKLAFLVLGPMLDLKLYMMYLRVFRPRLIWTIIPSVIIQVLLYTLSFHVLWENFAPLLHSQFPSWFQVKSPGG